MKNHKRSSTQRYSTFRSASEAYYVDGKVKSGKKRKIKAFVEELGHDVSDIFVLKDSYATTESIDAIGGKVLQCPAPNTPSVQLLQTLNKSNGNVHSESVYGVTFSKALQNKSSCNNIMPERFGLRDEGNQSSSLNCQEHSHFFHNYGTMDAAGQAGFDQALIAQGQIKASLISIDEDKNLRWKDNYKIKAQEIQVDALATVPTCILELTKRTISQIESHKRISEMTIPVTIPLTISSESGRKQVKEMSTKNTVQEFNSDRQDCFETDVSKVLSSMQENTNIEEKKQVMEHVVGRRCEMLIDAVLRHVVNELEHQIDSQGRTNELDKQSLENDTDKQKKKLNIESVSSTSSRITSDHILSITQMTCDTSIKVHDRLPTLDLNPSSMRRIQERISALHNKKKNLRGFALKSGSKEVKQMLNT